jgi:hypothetical protein
MDSLPHGPKWSRRTIRVKGDSGEEILDLWLRDIVEVVRELIKNRRFLEHMRFAPEKHWEDLEHTIRIYDEMWSGDWWWRIQVSADQGNRLHLLNTEPEPSWRIRNGCSTHPCYRQDPDDDDEWQQASLAGLCNHRKYQQRYSAPTEPTRNHSCWLHTGQRSFLLLLERNREE